MVSIAGSLVSKHRNHGFLFPGMLVSEGPDTGVTSPGILTDPSKAERELGWRAEYGINEMVRDSWNWQKRNPNGFE